MIAVVLFAVCVPAGAADAPKIIYTCSGYEAKDTSMFDGSMRPFGYTEEYAKSGKVSLKGDGSIEHSSGYLKLLNNVTFQTGKTYSVKFNAMASESTARLQVKLYGLSAGEVSGIPSVAVKCVEIGRNTSGEGDLLDCN